MTVDRSEPGTASEKLQHVPWIHGSAPAQENTDPEIQVHWHDADTVVMRQSMAVNYEAPFMYLLFGRRRAVLLDTGATPETELFPLRSVVDGLIGQWTADQRLDKYELIVLHTHAHGDHTAADGQFVGRPSTAIVGASREIAWPWFGLTDDLDQTVQVRLGGRDLEVLQSPGHHESAVTIYDPQTGWLLTGDSVYPGRLYVEEAPKFRATLQRLVNFCADRRVTEILGCHVEMSRVCGVDYPTGTTFQPDERELPMTVRQLNELYRAAWDVGDAPGRYVFDDFILEILGN